MDVNFSCFHYKYGPVSLLNTSVLIMIHGKTESPFGQSPSKTQEPVPNAPLLQIMPPVAIIFLQPTVHLKEGRTPLISLRIFKSIEATSISEREYFDLTPYI